MPEQAHTIERAAYLRRRKRQKRWVLLAQLGLLIGFFALWEIAAQQGWIDDFIMSSPSRIWKTLKNLYASGELFRHLGASCLETVIGFTLGTLAGTVIAILLWWSPMLSRILDPYLVVLNSLPKTALGPVFIVWMGAGPASIIAMTLAISLIVTILEVHNGFLAVDRGKLNLMKTLGASRAQTLLKLVLPANLPHLCKRAEGERGAVLGGRHHGRIPGFHAQGLGYLIVYGSQVFQDGPGDGHACCMLLLLRRSHVSGRAFP